MYLQGDSGGPLVCEGEKAYGVVYAALQYTIDSPVLYGYTKIAEYSNWIHSIMGSSDTCNNWSIKPRCLNVVFVAQQIESKNIKVITKLNYIQEAFHGTRPEM